MHLTDRPYEWVQKNISHFAIPKQSILLLTSAVVSLWSAECLYPVVIASVSTEPVINHF